MLNYIKADLKRLSTRSSRLVMVGVSYLILGILIGVTKIQSWSAYEFTSRIQMYLQYFIPFILGVIEIGAVYGDDFRAKTMQVAIGTGISRPMVVLAKLVELAVMTLFDLVGFCAITFASAGILQAGLTAEHVGDMLLFHVITLLRIVCFASVAMIPMFYSQGSGVGTLVYLAIAFPILPSMLGELLKAGPLLTLHLDQYIINKQLDQFGAYLLAHTFNLGNLLGIALHLLLCYFITVLLFRKRELEF